jgi:type IV pilus assembly protein PilA
MLKLIKKNLQNEKGLTLIELLVVVVILGIIASIAVVSVGGIIENTKNKAKVTEAVQIINAAKLAHTTDGLDANGWKSTKNKNELTTYISNIKDKTWTVTWKEDEKKYYIVNHESYEVFEGESEGAEISEDELTGYLNEDQ